MTRIKLLAWPAIFLWTLSGCAEQPPPRLTGIHLQQVDTLYRSQLDSLRLAIDSACAERHDERLAELVDSLVRLRREEERKMRERLQAGTKEDE